MSGRSRPIFIAGIVSMSAVLLLAGREVHAQQVGTLTNTRGLDFGKFVAGAGGTVVVAAGGTRSGTGGVILLNSPSAGAASFTVGTSGGGKPVKTVTFSLPSDGTVQLASGSNTMAVTTFVSAPAAGSANAIGSTPTVSVGATLHVAAKQPAGTYSGSFSLIANFQ